MWQIEENAALEITERNAEVRLDHETLTCAQKQCQSIESLWWDRLQARLRQKRLALKR